MEDDFEDFNPQKFWAKENGELVTAKRGLSSTDFKLTARLIKFLAEEKTLSDITKGLSYPKAEVIRLLALLRNMKHISIERKDVKGNCYTYRVIDQRVRLQAVP